MGICILAVNGYESYEIHPARGVRTVNNIPLYIVLGCAIGFVVVVAIVGAQRAHRHFPIQKEKASKDSTDTSVYIEQILKGQTNGIVPSLVEKKEALLPIKRDLAPLPPPLPMANSFSDTPITEDEKMKLMREAFKAKTRVVLSPDKPQQNSFTASEGNYSDQVLKEIDTELSKQKSLGNISVPDLIVPQNGQVKSNNNYEQFDKTSNNRWLLEEKVAPQKNKYTVETGFVIPATLLSGINSDLPGQIIAQISHNVYDTATGKYRLIPQGAKLIGTYSSDIIFGQSRVLIAWQRIVFPNGSTLDLGAMPGADAAGYAGFEDQVNNHYFKIFGSAFMMSAIIAGTSYVKDKYKPKNLSQNATSMQDQMDLALAQEFGEVSAKLIEKNLNVSPTLEIRPGYEFNVLLTKDLNFEHPYE